MKIIVAGASGFVGRQLIPHLAGHELILAGRQRPDIAPVSALTKTCSYDELKSAGRGADLFVNLSVLNNNSTSSEQIFFDVNCKFMSSLMEMSEELGVKRFVNVSSTHALDHGNLSPYARSKRVAAKLIQECGGNCETVYLAQVYGSKFCGALAFLNRMPRSVSGLLFWIVAAMKPVTDVQKLAEHILDPDHQSSFVMDTKEYALVDEKAKNGLFRAGKRLIDLAFVAMTMMLFGWLFILIWCAIRYQRDGSSIFKQVRVGRDEVPFVCYKFRTMLEGTKEAGTHEIESTSVTRIGRVLRRAKLDELPQIMNILKNEMSLIGPRPCLQIQTELVAERRSRKVFSVLPGLSGLAQINQIDMSEPKMLAQYDVRYVVTQGLLQEIKLTVMTACDILRYSKKSDNR